MTGIAVNLQLPRNQVVSAQPSVIEATRAGATIKAERISATIAARSPAISINFAGYKGLIERPLVIRQQYNQAEALVQACIAAATVGGHRAVRTQSDGRVLYANQTDTSKGFSVLGITLNSAIENGAVQVQRDGPITFSGWSWAPDLPVFLGLNGELTQTPPATGVLIVIGNAATPTSITIRIGAPLYRN